MVRNPVDVEAILVNLSRRLDDVTEELIQAETDYVTGKAHLEVERARAYMSSRGNNMEERKAAATLVVAELLEQQARIEALVKAGRENARKVYAQVDIARSVGVLSRAGMNL